MESQLKMCLDKWRLKQKQKKKLPFYIRKDTWMTEKFKSFEYMNFVFSTTSVPKEEAKKVKMKLEIILEVYYIIIFIIALS